MGVKLIGIPVLLGLSVWLFGLLQGDISISFDWIWWIAKWIGVPCLLLWLLSSLLPSPTTSNVQQQSGAESVPTYTNEEILMPGVDVRCRNAREQIDAYYTKQAVKQRNTETLARFFHGTEVRKTHNIFGGTNLVFVRQGKAPLEMSEQGSRLVLKEIHGRASREVYSGDPAGAVDYFADWNDGGE